MRERLLSLILILLLVVAGIAIIIKVIKDGMLARGLASQTLADGKLVTIEDITFGTNHVFIRGSKFLATVKARFPQSMQKWLGSQFMVRHASTEPSLIIWYSVFDPATQQYIYGNPDGFKIVDDHGCVLRIGSYGSDGSDPKFSVHHAYATVFPRRQKSFTLRAKFMNNPEVDFKIANRFQSTSVQELVSEPLPATRTVGSTNYVLSRLKVHSYNSGHSFEPRLKIAVDGEDRTDWFRPQFNYVDATGNRGYSLCAFEPALKIEADIYHSYKAPFDEDQIARMSNLEIPESGEFTPLAQRMDIGDVSLRFIALCGPGRFTFSNDVCVASSPAEQSTGGSFSSSSSSGPPRRVELSFQRKHPTLIVEIDGLNRSEELLVRGRNETNKLFRVDFNGSADRTYLYEVTTPTNSVRFDLEFIPQKALRLEYTVALPRREE